MSARAVVLVEGSATNARSPRWRSGAAETSKSEGVSVLPIGGAHAIGTYLERFGPEGSTRGRRSLRRRVKKPPSDTRLERAGMGTPI